MQQMRLYSGSKSNDRDSRKAKEAVADYKQAGLAPLEDYQNPSNRDDQVFSAISEDGSVKITACTARNLVNDLMIMHTMTAVPADAIGRTAVCALMMSNGMQEEQTCQITLNTDGPLRGVVAVSDGLGNVKGYVGSPGLGDISLPEAVGKGMVQVVKNHPDWSNPYNGITPIQHGDIDRDIGTYKESCKRQKEPIMYSNCFVIVLQEHTLHRVNNDRVHLRQEQPSMESCARRQVVI